MNNNRLGFAALVLAALATAANAAPATRSFNVTGFDRVVATGSENVTITTGKAFSVVATGPQERLDRLRIEVAGSTLKIEHQSGSWSWSWKDEPVQIAVTLPVLRGAKGTGSGDIVADSGTGPQFEGGQSGSGNLKIGTIKADVVTLRTSGSGDLVAGPITAASVSLQTSGSGDIAASGTCGTAKASSSGSGDLMLGGLACTNITVSTSGSGDVVARASGTADARTSGSGDVTITGGARCTSRSSGSGEVRCN